MVDIFSSILSNSLSKSISSPLQVFQIRYMCNGELFRLGLIQNKYNGLFDCLKRIITKEGYLAFWKGNLTNISRYFLNEAMIFLFRDKIRRNFTPHVKKQENYYKWMAVNIFSGGMAGALSIGITYPLDYVRVRLINNNIEKKQFDGIIDCLNNTVQSDGMAGLYRGVSLGVFGIFLYRGFYFGLFEIFKDFKMFKSFIGQFSLGFGVTLLSGFCVYPLDIIRKRMMMTSGSLLTYGGPRDCARSIWMNEGGKVFFNGFSLSLFNSIGGAFALTMYESFRNKTKTIF